MSQSVHYRVMDNTQHSALIDALGGTGFLAKELAQRHNTISTWRTRKVPWRWRPHLARMAGERGIPIPDGFLSPASIEAEKVV